VTSIVTSEAKHFDTEEMTPRSGLPRSARAAAQYTIRRAARPHRDVGQQDVHALEVWS
jgi:hypothetical protein